MAKDTREEATVTPAADGGPDDADNSAGLAKLAKNVRDARERAGLSREELAVRSGVSFVRVCAVEQHGRVSTATLVRLAAALGRDVGLTEPAPT